MSSSAVWSFKEILRIYLFILGWFWPCLMAATGLALNLALGQRPVWLGFDIGEILLMLSSFGAPVIFITLYRWLLPAVLPTLARYFFASLLTLILFGGQMLLSVRIWLAFQS